MIFLYLPGICQANEMLLLLYSPMWNGNFETLNTDPYNLDFSDMKKSRNFAVAIDIYGWKNMVRVNNTDYIYGNPNDSLLYDLYIKSYLKENDTIDRIQKDLTISIDDDIIEDMITVDYNFTFFWHSSELETDTGKKHIKKKYYTEKITGITDHEIIPQNFSDFNVEKCQAFLTFYNNSINPKTVIFVPENPGIMSIEYNYKNKSIKQNMMTGYVEHNKNGIDFVNFTQNFGWSNSDGNMSHIGKTAIIKGGNFSVDDLQIIAQTPYEKINITNYNISECDVFNGKNPVHYLVIGIFFVIVSSILLIFYVLRVLTI